MKEETNKFKKIGYLILIGVMSAAYFVYAVVVGTWEWIKHKFSK